METIFSHNGISLGGGVREGQSGEVCVIKRREREAFLSRLQKKQSINHKSIKCSADLD